MLACLWRPRYRFPNYSQGMLICVLCVHNKSVNPVIFRFNTPEFSMSPECVRCPWLQAETKVATILGIFPLFLGVPLFKTTEGVVVGFQIFKWAPK